MKETKICLNCKQAERDFLAYLRNHEDFKSGFFEVISAMFSVRTSRSAEVVVNEGEVCNEAFWLQLGYARCYTVITDHEGTRHEKTVDFCKAGEIQTIRKSFINGSPSEFGFQLAAGAVIIPFTRRCFTHLQEKWPEAAVLANKILAPDGIEKANMMRLKPRDRYREFLKLFGADIEQYFAVKHIASYLGMQPAYLSRLRGENVKK